MPSLKCQQELLGQSFDHPRLLCGYHHQKELYSVKLLLDLCYNSIKDKEIRIARLKRGVLKLDLQFLHSGVRLKTGHWKKAQLRTLSDIFNLHFTLL